MNIAFIGDSLTEGRPGVSYFELLKAELPDHQFHNYGLRGDTVKSLYRRLKTIELERGFDVAVVWIGVNDTLVKVSKTFPWIKRLSKQPWCKSLKEFSDYYIGVIDWTIKRAARIIVIPPLFIGEDPDNVWNRELAGRAKIIRDLTVYRDNIMYLDVRELFMSELHRDKISEYVLKSATRLLLDNLFLRSPERVDKKAARRGLQFTLDGVHLNSRGAKLVAGILMSVIEKKEPKDIASRFVFE